MFQPVSPKLDLQALEQDVLRFWKSQRIFEKSVAQRKGGPRFVFYEGPPTANGRPGTHHVLARVFKDMFPRYKTMRGHYVLRRGGWDTHGLPVEIEVEKKLGFTSKSDIERYGIAEFNQLCRQSAFEYIQEWEKVTHRIGFWVDTSEAYVTYTNDYIESVWWILRQLWDRELLYQGFKVVPYCPRCGTPLSDHEVSLGYQENTDDPSVFVRFPLRDDPGTYFLVWTTTPWTLPGNVALAVGPNLAYSVVEHRTDDGGTEKLILATDLMEKVLAGRQYRVVEQVRGRDLKGKHYRPLFTFLPVDKDAYYVVAADFVSTGEGTGVVHQAPAFGADDMQVALDHDLPVLMTVDPRGTFVPEVTPWRGLFVKDADPLITRDLRDRGLLFKEERYLHTYPFCWRCDTPLLYYARSTWYIRTTQFRDRLLALNDTIHWLPEHIKRGRFGNWLENNVDWALGRERYWGTPLPVWVCEGPEGCGHQHCVGSVKELSEMAGRDLAATDLHRPFVDEVALRCPQCGRAMTRVPELIDVWFDSGAMPVAQWHYPFENLGSFEEQFPADYICEAVDQTRGWFYSLHAISTMLFDSVSYKNVICLGLILDSEGQKMSKSRGNIIDPWEILDRHGADAFRWYLYTATPPGQERRFTTDLVGEVVRNFTLTLWNVYSFFVTYANLDGWTPGSQGTEGTEGVPSVPSSSLNSLDRWILSELHTLVREVTAAYEAYDVTGATRPVQGFVDDLSNWYLRRSRRRFWKSQADGDKQAAYATLHECLVTLAKLLAPAMPFLADALYRNLTASSGAPESVHLVDWPSSEPARIDERLNAEMQLVKRLASLGLAARSKANRKVRQPLAEAAFSVGSAEEAAVVERHQELLKDELNVKSVRVLGSAGEAVNYRLNPLPRQLGQKHGAKYPAIREALLHLDPGSAAISLLAGLSLTVRVAGEEVEVLPEEVEMRAEAQAGLAVMAEAGYMAALATALTPELVAEGLAREFVRRVQELRREAGLQVADRIHTHYQATPRLAQAVAAHAEYIRGETLSLELTVGPAPQGAQTSEASFDGEHLVLGLVRAG